MFVKVGFRSPLIELHHVFDPEINVWKSDYAAAAMAVAASKICLP